MTKTVDILGVPVHSISFSETLETVDAFVAERKLRPGPSRQIITANALMILAAGKNTALADAFRAADLVVPDSAGVILAGRVKGQPFEEQIPGIELMARLCRIAAERNWRIFLLGAAPGVAEIASQSLIALHTGLTICGTENGYFPINIEDRIIEKVANAAPDLLFVALDMPRQDIWIHKNLARLGCKVAMGVGGSFDVLAGRLRRAPKWMQSAGAEWLFRLFQEPFRARRMLGLPVFFLKVLASRRSK